MSESIGDEVDIVERLRRGFGGIVPPISDEAANLIEELRFELKSANEKLADWKEYWESTDSW